MDSRTLKIDLIQWLENLQDVSVLQQIASIKAKLHSDSKTENMLLPGAPMSMTEFKNRITAAEERIKNGQFTTLEDLESEMGSW